MINRLFPKCLPAAALLVFLFTYDGIAQDAAKTPATGPASQATPPLLTSKPGETPDRIVDGFFALLTRGQIDQAYDYLTNGTKIAEKPDEVANLKLRTREAEKVFGEVIGYESIGVQNVGTHLLRANYISIGRGFPLRWRFYFYRWDKTWKLIDIRVDDRLADMFDEKVAPTASGGAPSENERP